MKIRDNISKKIVELSKIIPSPFKISLVVENNKVFFLNVKRVRKNKCKGDYSDYEESCSNCEEAEEGEDCQECKNINPKLVKSHIETLKQKPNYYG